MVVGRCCAVKQQLLDTGKVDADSKDNDGRTPLSLVARSGHETAAVLLLISQKHQEPKNYAEAVITEDDAQEWGHAA